MASDTVQVRCVGCKVVSQVKKSKMKKVHNVWMGYGWCTITRQNRVYREYKGKSYVDRKFNNIGHPNTRVAIF